MGLLLSLLRKIRKKPSTDQILEEVEKDIIKYNQWQQQSRHLQNKIVLILVLFSIILYIVGAAILYRWFLPDKLTDRLLCLVPFLAFPIMVLALRRVLHFFFVTRINRFGKHLKELKEKKKNILESVTETEKYKVAKELLEKYDPKGEFVKRETNHQQKVEAQAGLRHRHQSGQPTPQHPQSMQRIDEPSSNQPDSNIPGAPRPNINRAMPQRTPPPPTPAFPILPRERTPFDKIAEYFIGDGPSYRYALICKRCKHHNGMALQDEFEFIEYHCCYCGYLNPARTKRSEAPPLFELDNDSDQITNSEIQSSNEVSANEEETKTDHSLSADENVDDNINLDNDNEEVDKDNEISMSSNKSAVVEEITEDKNASNT